MTADPQETQPPTGDTPPSETPGSAETPETTPTAATPSFGWNRYAERINGRFAMIGFVALLLLEFITRKDFFTWLGF